MYIYTYIYIHLPFRLSSCVAPCPRPKLLLVPLILILRQSIYDKGKKRNSKNEETQDGGRGGTMFYASTHIRKLYQPMPILQINTKGMYTRMYAPDTTHPHPPTKHLR